MGHIRLGTLPDTARWRHTIGLIAADADVAAVAAATTEAAAAGLDRAGKDPGVADPLHLLTQLVLSARGPDFVGSLRDAGVRVGDAPDLFDLTSAFADAADRQLRLTGRTDLGEMARLAAVEALTACVGRKSSNLFETTPAEVQRSVRDLSTQKGFAGLAHEFYSCFTARFLKYHLGRELGLHVGGNGVFEDTKAHDRFNEQLSVHCREAAGVTHRYAGEWYSKHNFQEGIDRPKARRFVTHCIKKIRHQVLVRGGRDG